jgi:molybdopterin converting factor subunit 1
MARSMRLHVRYFAAARDAATTAEEVVEVDDTVGTVAALRVLLMQRHPQLERVLPQCRLALDQHFVDDNAALRDGVEVAVLPPMAGG